MDEAWVIARVQAAGFKLEGKSEINANAKDTRDYAKGVWTLPPTLTLKDEDKAKYQAIGESDRMTLKFVKPAIRSRADTHWKAPMFNIGASLRPSAAIHFCIDSLGGH